MAESEGNAENEEPSYNLDDYLKESFENMLLIAKATAKKLKRPKDLEIAQQILMKSETFHNSGDNDIRSKNNIFFSYFLKVLNWTVSHQPLNHYAKWYASNEKKAFGETHQFLQANKTYMALKSLGNGNILLYMAASTKPEAGWQDGGLTLIQQKAFCKLDSDKKE